MALYGPFIEHGVVAATNNKPLEGKYFQILGFDILVNEALDCYLLEINDHPSLDIYLEKDFMGGGGPKTLSKIDLHVKKTVLKDAIKVSKKKEPVDNLGSLVRLDAKEDDKAIIM